MSVMLPDCAGSTGWKVKPLEGKPLAA